MDRDNYIEGIRSAWLGEQFGHAFFNAMAGKTNDPIMASRWRTLAQLELVTGNRMATLLEAHGESATTNEIIEISDEVLQRYTEGSHIDSMTKMKATIESALVRFDQLLAVVPDSDVGEIQFLVSHEQALLTFVDCEISGDSDNSLAAVNKLLES